MNYVGITLTSDASPDAPSDARHTRISMMPRATSHILISTAKDEDLPSGGPPLLLLLLLLLSLLRSVVKLVALECLESTSSDLERYQSTDPSNSHTGLV